MSESRSNMLKHWLLLILVTSASQLFAQDSLKAATDGKLWGFVNQAGVVVVPYKYRQVNEFREGYASVKLNERWGFIDSLGKDITPQKYDPHWDGEKDYADYRFSEGLAAVSNGGKYGYINHAGKEIIPLTYDQAEDFRDGTAVVKNGAKPRIINKANKNLLLKPYSSIFDFYEDRAVVILNGKYGVIDRKGKEITKLIYDNASGYYYEGFLVVGLGEKETFIDVNGKEIIPFRYGAMLSFSDGMSLVREQRGGLAGFINTKGELVIPMEFEGAHSFEFGAALVRKGGKWALIDKTGKPLTPFKYEDEGVSSVVLGPRFTEGMVALMYKGKFGYVDVTTGKEITPFKYGRAWPFYGGVAEVELNGKWGKVDKEGKEKF